jgi:hypothetical protein
MTWLTLWNICVTNDREYVSLVVNTFRSCRRSLLITGFVTRLTRRMSLVEQELLTLPYHRGNQNPYIEEEQTTRWPKEKVQRDKQ